MQDLFKFNNEYNRMMPYIVLVPLLLTLNMHLPAGTFNYKYFADWQQQESQTVT